MSFYVQYACMHGFSILVLLSSGPEFSAGERKFTIVNYCRETIWPSVIPGETFGSGGAPLRPGQSVVFAAPVGWSGRIWGRSGCNFDRAGNGSCQTGGCGSSLLCSASGKPPASLAEFTLGPVDFYDVSLVDGFNLPVAVRPINGRGNCSAVGCYSDLRRSCPKELQVQAGRRVVGCRSACDALNTDEYCCRGVYGNPATCRPTYYSQKFKEACPTAYSYAYDDPTSIFTCSAPDYIVTFCSTSRKQPVCTYHDHKLICSGSTVVGVTCGGKSWLMIILGIIITKHLLT